MTTTVTKVVIVYFISTIFCFGINGDNHGIPAIAKYFGSKSRYEEVNPYLILQQYETCKPIHLTAIIRHGTREPTKGKVEKMVNFYDKVKTQSQWKMWNMWYKDGMDGSLVEKGIKDHKNLAVRLSKMFPTLISENNLRNGAIKFITSSKPRCKDSIKAFAEGLTELWNIKVNKFDENDRLMRFFDHCHKYITEVKKNPSAMKELEDFIKGPEMKAVQKKIADQLNIKDPNYDAAEPAFLLCAFEFAIKGESSPWCQLFTEEDAKVLEYANDLKLFWKGGYGHDINRKSSCGLYNDLFGRLDKAAKYAGTEAVTIQVGHAETLMPLLTLLGFFKDKDPLTSKNYATQALRTFRTSDMLPFAANLVLVLYDCGTRGLRLQPLINEKPVHFPGLNIQGDTGPRFEDVRNHYKNQFGECNFDLECENHKQQPKV